MENRQIAEPDSNYRIFMAPGSRRFIMKKGVFSLVFVAISLFADCQDYLNTHALLAGHQFSDTIKIEDIFKFSEIVLDNKAYSIVSFTLFFKDSGYDYEFKSNSNIITDEMREALLNIKQRDAKLKIIVFKDIYIQRTKGKIVKIGDSIYKLKLE